MNVLFLDDQVYMVELLKTTLEKLDSVNLVVSLQVKYTENIEEIKQIILDKDIGLLITDIRMEEVNGIKLSQLIKKDFPHLKIIILTELINIEVIKQLELISVDAILSKSSSKNELSVAISEVCKNKKYYSSEVFKCLKEADFSKGSSKLIKISARQQKMLYYLSLGLKSTEIAEKMCITVNTEEKNRQRLRAIFNAKNTSELLIKARNLGFL